MTTFGYSGKSLAKKLGLQSSQTAFVLYPPDHYFSLLGEEASSIQKIKTIHHHADFFHAFYIDKSRLISDFEKLVKCLNEKGMIWISWPKKSSGIQTDIDENIVRDIGLNLEVVDVKVCAIDDTWSGLKFLRRKK